MILLLLLQSTLSLKIQASVSVSNSSIKSTTNLQFSLALPTNLQSSDSILIVFPAELTLDSQVLCSVDKGTSFKDQALCQKLETFTNGLNRLSLSKCFPSEAEIIFTVWGLRAPDYALVTESFQIYTLNQASVVIDSVNEGVLLEFFPVLMHFAQVKVDQEAVWTLQVSSRFEVDELVIEMPARDILAAGNSSQYCDGQVWCKGITSKG